VNELLHYGDWDRVGVVDFCETVLLHQGERSKTEEGVEHVCLVAWSVSDAATAAVRLKVLAVEYVQT
jgi:hypothetical protein